MNSLALILASVLIILSSSADAQVQRPPSNAEISKILGIKTWRVRKPLRGHDIWSIEMIHAENLRPEGDPGSALTHSTYLFALREVGGEGHAELYRFTLPQQGSSYSSGDIDLCKDLDCGATEITFFPRPRYSKDGKQCILATLKTLSGDVRYLALVVANYSSQDAPSK
jgi:hypothetical protein